jgi:competence protein ComEA
VPESSRSTIVVWALAAVLAVVAGARFFGGNDQAPPAPVRLAPERGRDEPRIYVHVVGAVRRPGLMTMSAGARVADALERAGGPGPRADLTAVNLAARLADGQQIVVPRAGAAGAAGGSPSAAVSAPSGSTSAGPGPTGSTSAGAPGGGVAGIHLSTATVEQLDGVDGIGPTLAQRIIEYRDEHGGFRSLADLAQVDGIGEKRLATLREALQL